MLPYILGNKGPHFTTESSLCAQAAEMVVLEGQGDQTDQLPQSKHLINTH